MLIFAQTDGSGAGGAIGVLFFIVLGAAFYFLPTIAAFVKGTPNKMSILIINLFLGWTFVGWIVALAMAFRDNTTPQQIAQQQVVVYGQPDGRPAPPQQAPPESEPTDKTD